MTKKNKKELIVINLLDRLAVNWSIDSFLKELKNHGIDCTLSISTPSDREVCFIIKTRKYKRDTEAVTKLLFMLFGYL